MTHVLLIEDDEIDRTTIAIVLRRAGISVFPAVDGRDGLRQYGERKPDLVITDIVMPNVEGIEVILSLRETDQEIPILAISDGGSKGDVTLLLGMASKLGATETLAKPFEPSDLLAAVDRCCAPGDAACARSALDKARGRAIDVADNRRLAHTVQRHVAASPHSEIIRR